MELRVLSAGEQSPLFNVAGRAKKPQGQNIMNQLSHQRKSSQRTPPPPPSVAFPVRPPRFFVLHARVWQGPNKEMKNMYTMCACMVYNMYDVYDVNEHVHLNVNVYVSVHVCCSRNYRSKTCLVCC